jgi:hypothetical protein
MVRSVPKLRNHTVWILLQTGAKFNQKRPQTEEMAKFKRFRQKSKGQRGIFCLNDGVGRENPQEFCRRNETERVLGKTSVLSREEDRGEEKFAFSGENCGEVLEIAVKTKDSGPLNY